MNLREIPVHQRADAEVLAALLGLIPVRDDEHYTLLPRREVIDLVEDMRLAGEREKAFELLAALEFDDETVFREHCTRVASKNVSVKTATLFRMLQEASITGEGRSAMMCRLLRPWVQKAFDEMKEQLPDEREEIVSYSLERWGEVKRPEADERDLLDVESKEHPIPVMRFRYKSNELPEDLRKYSRYFLKNLFRLNNIYGGNEFHYPPEMIERYWEFVSPNQGTFELEIIPTTRAMTLRLFEVSRSFGLEKTENPDYYGIVEFLAREARKQCIKGCKIRLTGRQSQDDEILGEMMAIEADLPEGRAPYGPGCIMHELTPEGLELFRLHLRRLSGIRAEVLFPLSEHVDARRDDLAVLGFDLYFDEESGRFRLDNAEASGRSMHEVVLTVGGKLLDLARQVYHDPPRFPHPNIEELDAEVHRLIQEAEEEGLGEETAKEIVAKITILDYYEGLANYSYAISEHLVEYLEGQQTITFSIPRVLLALLNRVLEEKTPDELVLSGLGGLKDT
ncbi:MAG: hypothetical protein GX307_05405 [Euryarchaeota archaeon]|nr:hypothetical protein [Euryarchaeota archaeon]